MDMMTKKAVNHERNSEVHIEKLLIAIQDYSTKEMNDEVQHLLASVIKAINLAQKNNAEPLIYSINIAFKAISAEKPNLVLATEIINSVMVDLKGGARLTAPVRVVIGLVVLLFVVIPILSSILPIWMNQADIFGIPTQLFLMVALFGAIGSIVSIMVRIQDFLTVHVKDNFILYLTGAFKPIIGMSFALFVLAVFKSGLIPLAIKPDAEDFFFMAMAFVTGFSERFARDIVDNIETKIIDVAESAGQTIVKK